MLDKIGSAFFPPFTILRTWRSEQKAANLHFQRQNLFPIHQKVLPNVLNVEGESIAQLDTRFPHSYHRPRINLWDPLLEEILPIGWTPP